jgi:hypothetical protein
MVMTRATLQLLLLLLLLPACACVPAASAVTLLCYVPCLRDHTVTDRHATATALPRTGTGIGIGICGESFFAGNMVGRDDDSIGWHPVDGKFYYKTAKQEELGVPLGTRTPSSF